MRVLLVYPKFPATYWGFQLSLELVGRRATLPPLGLVSLAALFPEDWDVRLVDMNVQPLADSDISWADVVLVSGMLIQEPSMHEITALAHGLGKRVVVGGPACTTSPERFADADALVLGEVEGRKDELVAAIEGRPGTARVLEAPSARPSMHEAPLPRFDLLDVTAYRSMAIQTSRGCPFACEFCDIIEIFGRVPRVKQASQVTAELDAIYELGYRGEIFIVDDNFIGNKKLTRHILGELARWQAEKRYPFTFYTEASLNLAADDRLIAGMREANFTSVFIGIETTDAAALIKAGKRQNVGVDVRIALDKLTAAGLEVMAGFIVGFDGEESVSFEAQRALLSDAPLPLAMAGLLIALPGTQLWRRLEKEGRLRAHSDGDAFGRPNFVPTMPERELLEGYAKLLGELYTAEGYFRRSAALVDKIGAPAHAGALIAEDVKIALRAVVRLGVVSERRGHFWKLLARAAPRGVHAIRTAIACAVRGEHMIRYTSEVVLPRIAMALERLDHDPVEAMRIKPRRVSLSVLDAARVRPLIEGVA